MSRLCNTRYGSQAGEVIMQTQDMFKNLYSPSSESIKCAPSWLPRCRHINLDVRAYQCQWECTDVMPKNNVGSRARGDPRRLDPKHHNWHPKCNQELHYQWNLENLPCFLTRSSRILVEVSRCQSNRMKQPLKHAVERSWCNRNLSMLQFSLHQVPIVVSSSFMPATMIQGTWWWCCWGLII